MTRLKYITSLLFYLKTFVLARLNKLVLKILIKMILKSQEFFEQEGYRKKQCRSRRVYSLILSLNVVKEDNGKQKHKKAEVRAMEKHR